MEQVWPGYWPAGQAFMIYQQGEAVLLVSSSTPPSGFVPLRRASLPAELRSYLYRGALPGLEGAFRIDYPAGAEKATAVALNAGGLRATLTTLFHEAFHSYQDHRFAPLPSPAGEFVDASQIAAPEFRAMAEVERRMLTAALDLPADSLAEHLRRYLAVRWIRTQSVPENVRAVERTLERKEGSAHLVGIQAALLATGGSPEQLAAALRPYLAASFDSASGGLPERLIRWRVYGTGSAIGLLLDLLGVDWRSRMERGATFDELLGAAVHFDFSKAPSLAPPALERFGFGDLMARASSAAAGPAARSVEEFYTLAPARLVVEFTVPIENGRPKMEMNFSAGAGGFSELEPNVFAVFDPEVFTLQVPQGSLVVRGRPVLQDTRGMAQMRLRVTVLLPLVPAVAVGGGQPLLAGEHRLERLRIDTNGVQLTVDQPVSVRVSPNEMVILSDTAQAGTRE
jgi:hypothetical protein